MTEHAPIYLLADSRPLFANEGGISLLNRIKADINKSTIKAVYVGASNGDEPDFYGIFTEAMTAAGIYDLRMISAFFEPEDKAFFAEADVILLAGGDVDLGWKTFQAVGLDDAIRERHQAGATLIGVSAGAVQLGMRAFKNSLLKNEVINTLQIVPMCIGAHEETSEWDNLKALISHPKGWPRGLGIPSGGAVICHPDQSFEAVYQPAHEWVYHEEEQVFKESLIMSAFVNRYFFDINQ